MLQFCIMHAISRAARSQQLNMWALHDSNARHAPPSATVSRWRLQLHRNKATHFIDPSLSRNQPVLAKSALLSDSITSGRSLLSEIAAQFPEATIAHFLGPNKLSRQLDDELQRIFV